MTQGGWLGDYKASGEQTDFVPDADSADMHRLIELGALADAEEERRKHAGEYLRLGAIEIDRIYAEFMPGHEPKKPKAPATRSRYLGAFRELHSWCSERAFDSVPIDPVALALFLIQKADAGASLETLHRYVAAARYVHELRGQPDPTRHRRVRAVLAANNYERSKPNGKSH